jgi:glycosylphosphatidylinositol transamidase (GPIT) subunit GPI8
MVVALFVIIGLAIIDRIFYSSFAFLNRINVNKKLNIDGPLIEPTV